MKPQYDMTFAVRDESIITDVVVQDEYRFRSWVEREGNAVVVDLGANLGSFTLLAASYGCKVVAVEADPKLFEALMTNLRANPWAAKLVVPFNVACTATSGDRWMHCSGTLSGGVMRAVEGHTPVSVRSRTLTEICELSGAACPSTAFLKCDIEGSETEVFVDPMISRFDAISLEWHNYDGLLFKALLTEAYGFDVQLEGCGDPKPAFDPTFGRGLLHAR